MGEKKAKKREGWQPCRIYKLRQRTNNEEKINESSQIPSKEAELLMEMANSPIYYFRYGYCGQKASVNAFQTSYTTRLYIEDMTHMAESLYKLTRKELNGN